MAILVRELAGARHNLGELIVGLPLEDEAEVQHHAVGVRARKADDAGGGARVGRVEVHLEVADLQMLHAFALIKLEKFSHFRKTR